MWADGQIVLDLMVAGVPVGAMYALAALGLVVVFRSTGNLDLSLGGVAAAAAYCYHHGSTGGGLPRVAAAVLALLVAAGCGLASAAGARVIGRDRPITTAVASLAWGGVLMAGCVVLFGADAQFVQPWLREVRVEVAGTVVTGHQLLVLALAVAVVLVTVWVLRRTSVGLAWRACADSREGAVVSGLRPARVEAGCYVVAAVFSGAAGLLLVPLLYLDATALTLFFLVKPAAAAVAGAMVSFPAALAAALVIGVLESLSVRVQDLPGLGEVVPLVVAAVAVLARRPTRVREKPEAALADGPTHLPGTGRLGPALGVVLLTVVIATFLTPYQSTILQLALLTTLLAATHVLFTGWGGQLCLAQPAFAGVGAICAARLAAQGGWPLPLAVAAGALAGAVAAGLLGALLAARITGLRFAVLSLGFGAACAGALFTWPVFAGTAEDRTLPPPAIGDLALDGRRFTVLVVAVTALALFGLRAFARSRTGAALVAGREHDRAAEGLGLPVLTARWTALTLSGAVAGLAGALTAYQLGTVAGEQFHPLLALPLLSAAALGGIESLWGAALGALILTVAPELLRQADAPTMASLVAPVVLLVVVLLRPRGLIAVRAPVRWPRVGQRPGRTGDTGLQVHNLVMRYGRRVAVDGIDLRVRPGEVVAVVGANGAGKTTVLDAISGAVRRAAGEITTGGPVVRTLQSGALFDRLTVRENLALIARWHRCPILAVPAHLDVHADEEAGTLAHGTARQIEILRALLPGPAVLLLDEPAAGLSVAEATQMLAMVRETAPLAAVLIVEHAQHVIADVDRVVVLDEGRILAEGPPAEVLADPGVRAVYLGAAAPGRAGREESPCPTPAG